jgi:hypothetical protein
MTVQINNLNQYALHCIYEYYDLYCIKEILSYWNNRVRYILILGASGFIGRHLVEHLLTFYQDDRLILVTRNAKKLRLRWNDRVEIISFNDIQHYNIDISINLAGAGLFDWPWTPKRIEEIKSSRVDLTKNLNEILAQQATPPVLSINASAIGYYGIQPRSQPCLEEMPAGLEPTAQLCADWEHIAYKGPAHRIVCLRLGVVLDLNDGALGRMLTPFRLGLGGSLASGDQSFVWVSIDDVIQSISYAIDHELMQGSYNVVSGQHITNKRFTELLAEYVHRPAWFNVPEFALKMIFKDGSLLLTHGIPVSNSKLKNLGFKFKHEDLKRWFDEKK